jgi:hydroxyacylglutathione hydrolase
MLLKYFYDQELAHASYMVGCQRAKVAVIVDPGRDIDQYLEAAEAEGVEVIAVAETHIHADYVSGARELADRVGAKLYLSDEGPVDWKYQFAAEYNSELLKNGDSFMIGKIKFEVMHTPGHTPESISFVLTDQGGGADKPMGIFTGDFVFVGSIGRPDLLEEAAGIQGSAQEGAHELFHSAERFKKLPDFLQVWPAHGAGSACGKGLGAIPSSTVGYEKRFNPALQFDDENAFVQYILADQPEAPKYFAVMKRVNKEGPKLIREDGLPGYKSVELIESIGQAATLIDLSPPQRFAAGHVSGSINIPLPMLASWAGWVVDYSKPMYLISDPDQLPEATRILRKIGLDQIEGVFEASAVSQSEFASQSYEIETPSELADRIESGDVSLVDVRSKAEWAAGHAPKAEHKFLGYLSQSLSDIDRDKPVVAQCYGGTRSPIAASIMQSAGLKVIDMAGGFVVWQEAELPVETSRSGAAIV